MSFGEVMTLMTASVFVALSGNNANPFTISLVLVPLG
jgi:hypothetical protein